jgi:monoamine oxidase
MYWGHHGFLTPFLLALNSVGSNKHIINKTPFSFSWSLSSHSSSSTNPSTAVSHDGPKTRPKVIVIGAGFSGLSVAYHLLTTSSTAVPVDVTIIEARDRIGGRVFPFLLDETTQVDLGGQWLHEASAKNPIRRLMEDTLQLGFVDKKADLRQRKNVVFDQDGSPIGKGVMERARKIFYKAVEEYDYSDPKITASTSLRDLITARLELEQVSDGRVARLIQEDPLTLQRALNYLIHKTEGYEGGMIEEVSASLADLYVNIGGPDEVPKGTYASVLDGVREIIAQSDGGGERIWLDTKVTRIEYDPLPVNNEDMKNCKGVYVTVERNDDSAAGDGTQKRTQSVLHCDYCVCTVPLGVLKQNTIEFIPAFPPARIKAIEAMGFGLLNKVVLKFDRCFWGDLKQFGMGHEDPSMVKTYYDFSNDAKSEAVLIQFLGGKAAARVERVDSSGKITAGLSDEEAVEESLQALRLIFGVEQVPKPVATTVTRWREDPFAFGSYSFSKVDSTADMYDEVASPLGNLLFAGEHTSKHGHSTVHGAWGTGKREASAIRAALLQSMPITQRQ